MFKILLLTIGLALILLAVCMLFAQIVFEKCFKRVKDPEGDIERSIQNIESACKNGSIIRTGREWLFSQPREEHYITSRDGLRLHGIFIKNPNSDRVAVLVHGYHGSYSFDFASVVSAYYHKRNCSVFLPDQRTHGESEGDYITFGAYERYDIVDWCKYIDDYTGNKCKFILSGVSMGATTVLLAAAEPDMIKLNYVTADCGYTDPKRIFTHVFRQWYHLPEFPILNIANFICKSTAKFSFDEFSTLDAVKNLKCPVTFVHGEADDFVLPENTYDNYRECTQEKALVTVPGAGHGTSYIEDPEKIEKEFDRIFDTYF